MRPHGDSLLAPCGLRAHFRAEAVRLGRAFLFTAGFVFLFWFLFAGNAQAEGGSPPHVADPPAESRSHTASPEDGSPEDPAPDSSAAGDGSEQASPEQSTNPGSGSASDDSGDSAPAEPGPAPAPAEADQPEQSANDAERVVAETVPAVTLPGLDAPDTGIAPLDDAIATAGSEAGKAMDSVAPVVSAVASDPSDHPANDVHSGPYVGRVSGLAAGDDAALAPAGEWAPSDNLTAPSADVDGTGGTSDTAPAQAPDPGESGAHSGGGFDNATGLVASLALAPLLLPLGARQFLDVTRSRAVRPAVAPD